MIRTACVTGRFQPVHLQHVELFLRALDEADRLIVAITNPTVESYATQDASLHRNQAEANPFDVATRTRLLAASLTDAGIAAVTSIVAFDIFVPDTWEEIVPLDVTQVVRVYSPWEAEKVVRFRAAGYPVRVLNGDNDNKITASQIRASLFAGGHDWEAHVTASTRELLHKVVS
ncbi:MAG: adenylyltransferase/cytidyltransferase family protein [Nitriliruptoraceae bacterium]